MQAGYYRVDHDYIINSARLAKNGGCSQFHLVSSVGANKDSMLLATRAKVCRPLYRPNPLTLACLTNFVVVH